MENDYISDQVGLYWGEMESFSIKIYNKLTLARLDR